MSLNKNLQKKTLFDEKSVDGFPENYSEKTSAITFTNWSRYSLR